MDKQDLHPSSVTPVTDPRLSMRAVGAWSRLARMADDRMAVPSAVTRLTEFSDSEGPASVRSAMKELSRYGYVAKVTLRYEGGAISGHEWHLNPQPAGSLKSAA